MDSFLESMAMTVVMAALIFFVSHTCLHCTSIKYYYRKVNYALLYIFQLGINILASSYNKLTQLILN